jgi:replicative DNA helicase
VLSGTCRTLDAAMSHAPHALGDKSAQDAGTSPVARPEPGYGRSPVSAFPDRAPAPPSVGAAPPHSLEAEQSVLGAILLSDRTLYALVIDEGLQPEDFYRERHAAIYESILELYAENEPIDVLTVTEHLRSRGKLDEVGGADAVDALAGAVPAAGNARRYAQIVREHALMRRLLSTTYDIQAQVLNNAALPRDIVEHAERAMFEVAHDERTKDFRNVGDVLHEEIDKWQKLASGGQTLTGTPSGFSDLDEITGGFQPGNLVIVAARPSMGKCLCGSSLVHDPMTGARRRLADVVAAHEAGRETWVTSLGPDLRLRPARVSATFRNGRRRVFSVRTRLGREIKATGNHPLLTINGWRQVDELTAGARIAVPRSLPHRGRPGSLPDHELVLLGALIADGCLGGRTPRFVAAESSPLVPEVLAAAQAIGARTSTYRRGSNLQINLVGHPGRPNPVTALCRRHGQMGKLSGAKHVPDAIFGLDEDGIRRFLSILYACDGHIYAGERFSQVGYTTISERLARDVQHLLLRLGIVAAIRELKRPVYDGTGKRALEVRITGQAGIGAFCELIPVVGKQRAAAAALTRLAERGGGTNVDTIPAEIWAQILDAKGDRPWADISDACGHPRNHNWHVGARGVSRLQLGRLAAAVADEPLEHLASSDLWWDEILSIDPAGEEETYDLTVPVHHNFVADDIVVHNSALVTNMAENVALSMTDARPVALFSLEMSEAELAQRFIASQASIKGDDLRKGRIKEERKWKRVLDTAEHYSRAPLYIDDSSDIGILEIRAKARRLHAQHASKGGLGLIIIDYLQLMRPDHRVDSRVEQVGQMSRGLKILARKLGVPVIALSQLSRGVESRTDKRPLLSDLRECVTGETPVVLSDGRRVPIRDLVGTTPEVLAVGDDDRVGAFRSDCVWEVGRRPVVRVRLASGRSLRCTASHRIRAGSGWQRAGELLPGDRVALARRLPEPAAPDRWADDRVVLLGQLIGDGSYLSGQPLRYTTASEENSRAVAEAARREFGAKVTRHEGRGSWHQLVIAGNGNRWHPAGLNKWLRDLGVFGQRSHEKRVPAAAFRLPDDQVALLLRHLWATDGCVFVKPRAGGSLSTSVYFATSSEGLAGDVAALLLRLGVVARTTVHPSRGGRRSMHHVSVSGAAAQLRFLDLVGGFGPRETPAASLRHALAERGANTNVDTLPVETWATIRAAMTAQGISTRAMAALRGTSYGGTSHFRFAPSRAVVADYAEHLASEELAAAAANDLFWDRVVAVEPDGEETVYDLTVPGPANWLADGLVTHNSGQIEQDADLVMFIYRDEYYNENTDRPGEADLIIAKHRNGGLGDVPLTFQGEYPRFLSIARGI